jgi:4-hydroxybutyrate CoA-transferase
MGDWKRYYTEHLTTAAEAVARIQSGDRVAVGHACGEPSFLVDALVANAAAYENVEIVHMVAMGKADYCRPEYARHFRHNALFAGGSTREAVNSGRADFTPCFFSEAPALFSSTLPLDVALVMVAPPNEHGMCSLGVSVDYTYEAVKQAKLVIAQVNREMPFTLGGSLIPVGDVDCFVPYDAPVIQLPPPQIGPVERAIGENIASLVRDGDTLQLGIGAIPDAVLSFLKGKHDLGIHSEMFSDGVVELVEAGVITNARKTLHPGKSVATFLMGTRRLYNYVDHNPDVFMAPVDYVNDPRIIAQNDNLVSINSCVQVDLMGQVNSESIGPRQISGVGGQVDFVRGAAMSRGGRSIIAMPSTVKGKTSKIVPLLDSGSAVTTSRCDVDYVVTEYGVAHLKGASLRHRAAALISIAHPDFRAELQEYARSRFDCNN